MFGGNPEVCDGLDNNCDTVVDNGLSTDADADGVYAPGSCFLPNDDCDDGNPNINPTLSEVCDSLDNDCNSIVDDGLSTDGDADGHYTPGSCYGPADDCDDAEPLVFGGNPEVCDGLDNNCDTVVDNGLSTDGDGDGVYAPGSCYLPNNDCDDGNPAVNPTLTEVCDGLDNDCNTVVDEGLSTDADADGHYTPGSCLLPANDCDDLEPLVFGGNPEVCDGLDNNCDTVVDNGLSTDDDNDNVYAPGSCFLPNDDCDDGNPAINPTLAEVCDGLDNDCNTVVDDGLSTDLDGDGHYTPGSCFGPADDCDDDEVLVYGGNPEVCDGLDNNCDTLVDNGLSTDADGDGVYAPGSCFTPNDDCDDNNGAVVPGSVEICDGFDNDCNGIADDGLSEDLDGDGFYNVGSCQTPANDCNDNDAAVNPAAPEICNRIDGQLRRRGAARRDRRGRRRLHALRERLRRQRPAGHPGQPGDPLQRPRRRTAAGTGTPPTSTVTAKTVAPAARTATTTTPW